MATRLITIPFSHYCEKARWALDRCDLPYKEEGHLPLFHYVPAKRAGGGRTVPILVDENRKVVPDSTEIIAWADDQRPGALLPANAADRTDALALEDDFDRHLGPAARRWAYGQMLHRSDLDHYVLVGVPKFEALALKATRPIAVRVLKRQLKIDDAGIERSRLVIEDTFDRIAKHLADGRRFLIGDAFSVADLTFASLAAPILLPDKHPTKMPSLGEYGDATRVQITKWRETPAGELGMRLYRDHRDERMTVVVTSRARSRA
jgi:glutathione S-transferase